MTEAYGDAYKTLAALLFDVPRDDVTPAQRLRAKTEVLKAAFGLSQCVRSVSSTHDEVTLEVQRGALKGT